MGIDGRRAEFEGWFDDSGLWWEDGDVNVFARGLCIREEFIFLIMLILRRRRHTTYDI